MIRRDPILHENAVAGSGIETTLRVLLRSKNRNATPLLLIALEQGRVAERRGAARALALRDDPAGHRALVSRFEALPKEVQQSALDVPPRGPLTETLEKMIAGGNSSAALQAAKVARRLGEMSLLPTLVEAARRPDSQAEQYAPIVLEMAASLAKRIQDYADADPAQRPANDPVFDRRAAVNSLVSTLGDYDEHGRTELLEALLMLAPGDEPGLLRALTDESAPAHAALIEALHASDSPGVFDLLTGFLTDPSSPIGLARIAAERTDAAAIAGVLRRVKSPLGARAQSSCRRIKAFAWLESTALVAIFEMEGALQAVAVEVLAASSAPPREFADALLVMIQKGAPEAQLAAAKSIANVPDALAGALLRAALQSKSPQVIAAAARLLRPKSYPDAVGVLVQLLDHQETTVRWQAQQCLNELSVSTFREVSESLSATDKKRLGRLVGKADPMAPSLLASEIRSGAASRRMSALDDAELLGVVDELVDLLTEMTTDPDTGIRAEAVRLLGAVHPTPDSIEAIEGALADRTATVRRAAEAAYEHATRREPGTSTGGGDEP